MATSEEQQKQIDQIFYWFRGNGEKGVFETMRDLGHDHQRLRKDLDNTQNVLQDVMKTVERMDRAQRDQDAMLRGASKTLSIIGLLLTMLGTGGFVYLGRLLGGIAGQLP